MAWKLTYLPDPQYLECVKVSQTGDLLEGALQDPRQLTALVGQAKDLKTLMEKVRGKNWWDRDKKKGDPKGKGKGKNDGASGGADDH